MMESISLGQNEVLFQLVFSGLLGLFLGLEREWSNKTAGIRTFSLIAIIGAIFGVSESDLIIASGVLFVTTFSFLLGVKGILSDEFNGLSLTTSASMMVVYGIGVIVSMGLYTEGAALALVSTLLLVLKRELHGFSSDLNKEELQSAAELAIISIVVYPLLPTESFGPWDAIDARLVWTLIIAVSAIGFVNYVLLKKYEEKGLWVTSFVGGLVNSTAVIISITDRVGEFEGSDDLAIFSILMANAAMSARNLVIAFFFLQEQAIGLLLPLGAITIVGVIGAYITYTGGENIDVSVDSPFSKKNAFTFGGIFVIILLLSSAALNYLGDGALIGTLFSAGLVSSGTSTTTAIAMFQGGQISQEILIIGIFVGTIASLFIKIGLAIHNSRTIVKDVLLWNALLVLSGIAGVILTSIIL